MRIENNSPSFLFYFGGGAGGKQSRFAKVMRSRISVHLVGNDLCHTIKYVLAF